MKKFLFFLLALIAASNICFAQNAWIKIDVQTSENLQKVIILNTKTLIFSNSNCYIGTNLDNWEKIDIPDSYNICPVVFKGYIYINCKDGVYKSLDGNNWEKSSSLSALSLAANEKKIFAFTNDPNHIAFESSNGIDFSEIAGVKNLYSARDGDAEFCSPNFKFAEAFGDTIYASGLTSSGQMERTCRSFDNGITWASEGSCEFITDMELGNYGLVSTVQNHIGAYFIVHGKYSELALSGGVFRTLKYFDDNLYCGGINYSKTGGVIMLNNSIGNIFYTPEPINRLASNQYYMIAVGEKGSVYVLKNDFTDYLLSAKSTSEIQSASATSKTIFPNPVMDVLNITTTPGETIKIIDLNGKIIKSLVATEEQSSVNVCDLSSNIYIIKSGNRTGKFIKK